MLYFKSCNRCQGDLYEAADIYGRYVACVQCGHYLTEAEERWLKLSPSRRGVRSGIFVWMDKVAA